MLLMLSGQIIKMYNRSQLIDHVTHLWDYCRDQKIQYIRMDNSISQAKRQELKLKINSSRKAIQALLKQFKYLEEIPHEENMRKLCTCLENVMNVDTLSDFHRYLSNKQLLPIQLNFKSLKYEKLAQIFQDWVNSKEQNNIGLDRALTHKHRNILFKRIFLEQKQTIHQYFTVLSQKKKLRGFDLFQLLTELLGPYFLYQYNSDAQTFFQKTNSFENFTTIVDSFTRSGSRVYTKDRNDPNDESYVRLHQIEALIQFWQIVNPQLTLQEMPKKNMIDAGFQTNQVNSVNVQIQTDREINKSYVGLINRSMHDINYLIETQNDPELLESLDKILTALRTQKIFAVAYESQKNTKKMQRCIPRIIMGSDYSETQPILLRESPRRRINSPSRNRTPQKSFSSNPLLLTSQQDKEQDDIKIIFRYLSSLDTLNCLTIQILQQFVGEIGVARGKQFQLMDNLVHHGFVQDQDDISIKQFKAILRQLMKENKKFNMGTLKAYIGSNINESQLRKTAYFKNDDSNTSRTQILNQSIMGGRERARPRDETQTSYPLDSDGSNI